MRKLILLALGGAAAAYAIKSRADQPATAGAGAGGYAPSAPAGEAASTGEAGPTGEEATADTLETEALVPDVSADDPLVRQQEDAAAAEAGSIGGPVDSVTADVDPEMRPVVEGSGDAEETFEETEDQGR
jgi:hypothetical protein